MTSRSPIDRCCAALPFLVAACTAAWPARAQVTDDSARADRAAHSLLPAVRVRGRIYSPKTVDARLAELHVPALSVAVISDGRLAWARAFGVADAATGRRATPATLFQAASMSKPLTAVVVLQLVAAHRISLDQDVNDALRSWRLPDNEFTRKRAVTIREILSHTAGVNVPGFAGFAIGDSVPTLRQLLDGIAPAHNAPVRVVAQPGSEWHYSGGGYTILQQLVEDVTGKPFAIVVTDNVLRPARMTMSSFDQPLPVLERDASAAGHLENGEPIPGGSHVFPQLAAAGLWATPTDLARFVMALQRSIRGDDGLLPESLARDMVTPGMGSWGLGLQIQGGGDTAWFSHSGANEGFRGAFFGRIRSGDGVVVMTNSDGGVIIADEMVRAVAAVYGWPGFAPRELVPVALDSTTVRAWVGEYARGPVRLIISQRGDRLYARVPGGQFVTTEALEFVPVSRDRFTTTDGRLTARVIAGANGQVSGLEVAGMILLRQP